MPPARPPGSVSMREMMLVVQREFLERVRTRSFAIGTLLLPIFLVALLVLPSLVGDGGTRRLVVVVEGPQTIATLFVASLNQPPGAGLGAGLGGASADAPAGATGAGSNGAPRYDVELVAGPVEPLRAGLVARIEAEELDGYVVIPADVRESSRVLFRSTRVPEPSMMRDIRQAATQAVQADRLTRSGLQLDRIAGLLDPVIVDDGRVDRAGSDAGSAQRSFYFAYFVAMIIYFMIAMYGTGVTRSVLEEKNNRIAEVLVSSMDATHLMAGKVLGVTGAVMLQLGIWLASIILLVTQSQWMAQRFGIDPSALSAVTAEPLTTALLIAYFIMGFLLFAALFAALGAAVTTDQEAQSFQMLFMLPLFAPLLFLLQLTTQPLEPLARTLGMLPFTSPVAMPMRMASAPIPLGEVLLSLGLLAVTLAATAWLAGKIYRIGILFTGRRPGLAELGRWIRAT